MKKFLMILGGIAVAILVIAGVVAAIFIPRLIKLDKEAVAYVADAVPKIANQWDIKELADRATPDLQSTMKANDDGDRLFLMFQQLGSLKHLDPATGTMMSSTHTSTGPVTVGNYQAHATFEKGAATIQVQLRRENDAWKISGFHINSDVFLPAKKG